MMNLKGMEGSVRLIVRYSPGIRLEGQSKTTKNMNQDSWSEGTDLNLGPPKHEAGVLTTRTQRSVGLLSLDKF
jgi:hypothetical protein